MLHRGGSETHPTCAKEVWIHRFLTWLYLGLTLQKVGQASRRKFLVQQ